MLTVIITSSIAWTSSSPTVAATRCPAVVRAVSPCAKLLEANAVTIEEQKAEFFALMPSEKLPEVSLDLRGLASKSKDHVQAKVVARQEGTVTRWTDVGTVATLDEASLTDAVAKQRAIIVRWAYLVCNDFETDALLMNPDGPPIELQWFFNSFTPNPIEALMGKKVERKVVPVPRGTVFEEGTRCGFLGKPGRERRGGGVTARYDKIEWPDEPLVGSAFE